MLRLLRRPKVRPTTDSLFRTRLRLECLEGRELPSVAPVLDGLAPGGSRSTSQLSASELSAVAAPQIMSFTANQISAYTWILSGMVYTPDPLSTTVQLGGLASLGGISCAVHPDGSFSVTVTLQSGESGTASAQATDSSTGLASAFAYCAINPIIPSGYQGVPGGNKISM